MLSTKLMRLLIVLVCVAMCATSTAVAQREKHTSAPVPAGVPDEPPERVGPGDQACSADAAVTVNRSTLCGWWEPMCQQPGFRGGHGQVGGASVDSHAHEYLEIVRDA